MLNNSSFGSLDIQGIGDLSPRQLDGFLMANCLDTEQQGLVVLGC